MRGGGPGAAFRNRSVGGFPVSAGGRPFPVPTGVRQAAASRFGEPATVEGTRCKEPHIPRPGRSPASVSVGRETPEARAGAGGTLRLHRQRNRERQEWSGLRRRPRNDGRFRSPEPAGRPPAVGAPEGNRRRKEKDRSPPECRRPHRRRGLPPPRPARDGPPPGDSESLRRRDELDSTNPSIPIPASACGAGYPTGRIWGRPRLRRPPEPEPPGKRIESRVPAGSGAALPGPDRRAADRRLTIRGAGDSRRDSIRETSYLSARAFAGFGVGRPGGAGRGRGDAPSSPRSGTRGGRERSRLRRRPRDDGRSRRPGPTGRCPAVGAPPGAARSRRRRCFRPRCTRGGNG